MMTAITYSHKLTPFTKLRAACLVLPKSSSSQDLPHLSQITGLSVAQLKTQLRQAQMNAQAGELMLLLSSQNPAMKVILIGNGETGLTESRFKDLLNKLVSMLNELGVNEVLFSLTDLQVGQRTLDWKISQTIQVLEQFYYAFYDFKSKKPTLRASMKECIFHVAQKSDLKDVDLAIERALAITAGISFAKDLANTPPNICTPTYIAQTAKKLAKNSKKISCAVLDQKQIKALGMGLMLSVAQGSENEPKLITLEYRNADRTQKPVVLVGKGITFDTGGHTIKVPPNMIGMKYDMCGGATVLGVFHAVAALGLKINLIGIIPSCENSIGPKATRPEDIIKSMSGHMVEILNTDAEGRLILADALTYAERFHPSAVIDIATLTGASMLALGPYASGLMSNHDPLAQDLINAGHESFDRVWALPLWDEYADALKSDCADFANVPMTDVGARTAVAGAFLAKFARKYHWAHLDVANTATGYVGMRRGPTGRPIPLLVQYLIQHSQK